LQIFSESDYSNDISYAKYKEMLINAIKDILEILGYDIEKTPAVYGNLNFSIFGHYPSWK
jgi:hypothetical protein